MMKPESLCSEASEQAVVVRKLRESKVLFFSVPNGGFRQAKTAIMLSITGVESGVPDLIIVDRPPISPQSPGAAIEMKKKSGGNTSPSQKKWIIRLENLGWLVAVCNGADSALAKLREWGYPV